MKTSIDVRPWKNGFHAAFPVSHENRELDELAARLDQANGDGLDEKSAPEGHFQKSSHPSETNPIGKSWWSFLSRRPVSTE